MKKLGIHMRLFIAAFLLIGLTALILDIVAVNLTKKFIHKRFEDRITFLAKYLALNSEVGILIGDRKGLNSLALNLLGEEDVAKVTILDSEGRILVDQKREINGRLSIVTTPVMFKKNREENLIYREITTPFGHHSIQGEDSIGSVQIAYTTQGLERLVKRISRNFIWLSIGLTIFAGIMFFVISRPIVVEVKRLAITARQVGRGDISLRAQPGKIPETKSLANDFNSMLESLRKSQEALEKVNQEMVKQKTLAEMGKFSLMIAHEFKNPLSIIKTSLDILKKDKSLDSEDTMVAYMEDEIRRLDRLIEEFLMFARPITPNLLGVDLNDMLRTTVDRYLLFNEQNGISIQYSISENSVKGKADVDLFSKALENIIKNACDAIENEGEIFISSDVEDDFWIVEISDSGKGIPSKHIKKIFDPFYTTRAKGTGLGLSFVLQVIKAHYATISAKNGKLGGAVFRVKMPVISD